MKKLILLCVFLAGPGWAACPKVPDISSDMDVLIERARAAENDRAGAAVSNEMWQLWLTAPDQAAQEALEKGMRARESYDFLSAIDAYEKLIAYCPDYAEGYNQRAFIYFLQGAFEAALVDLDKALDLSPRHVGAQSGRALTLMNLGRISEARIQLVSALENNPWLSERFLMAEGGPLAPTVEDI